MFILEYLKDLITKKTCCVCGKRERTLVHFKEGDYCVNCLRKLEAYKEELKW